MTLMWLLLGAAVLLAGGGRGPREHGTREHWPQERGAREREPMSVRALQTAAVVGVVLVAVLVLGAGRGLLVAAVVAPLAAMGTAALHARPARPRAHPQLALALDLVAVVLRSGRPLAAALALAAPAAGGAHGDALDRVAGLLRLGADPAQAWQAVHDDPVLAPIAAAAQRSASSGIRLAATFEELAGEVRVQVQRAAQARAERAGVLAAAPLGLCFLPAFVCLGIAPTVIGIARGVLATR